MRPKRGTKAYLEETTSIIYGINPRTKKLAMVFATRGGLLHGNGDDGAPIRHPIKPGWTADREAELIFGLRETFSVPPGLQDGESTKRRIEELRAKAEVWDDEAWLKGS